MGRLTCRQRCKRRLCLSDFLRSQESGEIDVVGSHVVTMGRYISDVANELFARNAYREYLELHGLRVQLTEALGEHWHSRVQAETRLRRRRQPSLAAKLSQQAYRGSRCSFGYPACANLADQDKPEVLLDRKRIGVELSEEHQLTPEQSTSAIFLHHPRPSTSPLSR